MGRIWNTSRIAVLACLATTAALAPSASASTGPVPGLDPAALEVMNQPAYADGQWFISVRDLDTGQQLIDLAGGALVEPGSVVKTYSMGAGWLQFGPDHKVVTPVKRTGRDAFLRNVLIAIGNSGDAALAGEAEPLLGDPSPVVRAAAVWALGRLLHPDSFAALANRHAAAEKDEAVRAEWSAATRKAAA